MNENDVIKEICEMANMLQLIPESTKGIAVGEAIFALQEIKQYREIGTVKECKDAVERTTKKKYISDGEYTYCPICKSKLINITQYAPPIFCSHCGQRIDWSD